MDRKSPVRLDRLYHFLASLNPPAASHIVKLLVTAPNKIAITPRLGERLHEFEPREVRRIIVGNYEMRYEIQKSMLFILRIWHTRENR